MKQVKTKATIGVLATLISYVSWNSWYMTKHPDAFSSYAEDRENASWVATSHSWIDRKVCRWLTLCGGSHMKWTQKFYGAHVHHSTHGSDQSEEEWDWRNAWTEEDTHDHKSFTSVTTGGVIPDYVFEYAPLVHLSSDEQYWPCDIAEHLYHTTPTLNYTPIESENRHATLQNLNQLNRWNNAEEVYLTSDDNVEERPEWLEGAKNIPAENTTTEPILDNEGWVHHPGRTYWQSLKDVASDIEHWYASGDRQWEHDESYQASASAQKAREIQLEASRLLQDELKRRAENRENDDPAKILRGGRSGAPAILIVVEKGHGVVDAFWFFFYSFNLGNSVFNIRFGNHIGDWEHSAVRFHHGKPKAVYFSEHNFGSVYSYDAVEKLGKRPVIYSAAGTHAMYPTAGTHAYGLPWGILHDKTDRGPLWDPALNAKTYVYDMGGTLKPSTLNPEAPIGWFYYAGRWGDKFYPLGDHRQYRFAGQYHYVSGPYGPRFKNLRRKKICGGPPEAPCTIKHWLGPESRARRWKGNGEEADAFTAAAKI